MPRRLEKNFGRFFTCLGGLNLTFIRLSFFLYASMSGEGIGSFRAGAESFLNVWNILSSGISPASYKGRDLVIAVDDHNERNRTADNSEHAEHNYYLDL